MSDSPTALPPNVYRVARRRFDAIPGSPWVYWVSDSLRGLFETLPKLGDVAQPRQGLATADNGRFLRYWWEVGHRRIAFSCRTREEAQSRGKRWFPCMKGGEHCKWYGNLEYVVNWARDGEEIRNFYSSNGRLKSRPQNLPYYFREGITWSLISSGRPSFRYMPPGWIITHKGPGIFLQARVKLLQTLGTLNSTPAQGLLTCISPNLGYEIGQVAALPWPKISDPTVSGYVGRNILISRIRYSLDESSLDFSAPPMWSSGINHLTAATKDLASFEADLDKALYQVYRIQETDEASLNIDMPAEWTSEEDEPSTVGGNAATVREELMSREALSAAWVSHAIGVLLGRFRPGVAGELGSAVYRPSDFAMGSLPEPDEEEFNELVGPPDRFAYIDAEGGRHVFSAEVEQALRDLAVPDGITVLDEGHPRDLPALVEKALTLMWGEESAREIIAAGAGGDLRKFLERDYFTKWHLKWYRKRPVYWPLQSAKRNYGFVIFHEKIEGDTLYVLQREYLDQKLKGLRLEMQDLRGQMDGLSGRARKLVEKDLDRATQLLDEVTEFGAAIERIAGGGYRPKPNWIDDGVILRLAPLWELIPIWKTEPRKYWEGLQKGDYDWSHIAMNYWAERVKEKCKTDKSLAIAHGA